MLAVALSQRCGFLGGNVFPMLFIGGVSGLFVHAVFPDVPVALCVSAMMAAVPGATLSTPLSIILVAVAGVGLGTKAVPPIIMAVLVAQLLLVSLKFIQAKKLEQTK
jgi:H+/Cl- antiporter ClcA